MIPLVQPTVSFIKKWGQSLHICRAHHWHQDFQLEIPAGSAVKSHAERRGITQFGHESPPVPPLSSRNCCCLVPDSFSTLFSHTHALAKQTHTHTHILIHSHRLYAAITIFEVPRSVPALSLNIQHGGCCIHIAQIPILWSSSKPP